MSKKTKFTTIFLKSVEADWSHIDKLCKEGAPPNVINAEIRKMQRKAAGGREFVVYIDGKKVDNTPFHLQKRLDNICVICGRVPNEGEYLRATMVSPWHCRFCKCPECGERSSKIKLRREGDRFKLVCACGWELLVGL